jgi:hypothetical protein
LCSGAARSDARIDAMAVLVSVFGVVLALVVVLVAGLLRSHAEILRELHGLGVDLDPDADPDADPDTSRSRPAARRSGDAALTVPKPLAESRSASDVAGVTPDGDAVSIAVVGVPDATLLAFLTTGCTTCADFWTAFADHDSLRVPGGARLVVVTKGADAESPARLRRFAAPGLDVVLSSAAWDAYDVPVAPYFAYVDGPTSAIVGEGAAMTWDHLASMMDQALADAGMSSAGTRSGSRRSQRRRSSGKAREARIDDDLLASGITPGHASLYPTGEADLHEAAAPTRPDGGAP